jgi:hypothetical protein
MKKIPTIQKVLQYKNPYVIQRYQRDFPDKQHLAEELFTELLKYLWLGRKLQYEKEQYEKERKPVNSALDFDFSMHKEMLDIDHMWHTFILFTKEYTDFCQQYFCKYIHHAPNVSTTPPAIAEFEADFTKFLSYVYDNLGEDTLRKWFAPLFKDKD